MINRSPLNPLQAALVAVLRGDATLKTLLAPIKGMTPPTVAVVDQPPEGQAYPYVTIGEHISVPSYDLTSFGRDITETLHVWTRVNSNGPGQAIANRLIELLDHQHRALSAVPVLASAGQRIVRISCDFDQALRDPDPQIRHHVVRFRIETTQLN